MKYENEFYMIDYNECEIKYINELTETINSNLRRLMEYFEIKEFRQKKLIRIWNNLESYVTYITPFVGEYQNWMVADTYDHNINILSIDLFLSSAHKNSNISDYRKIIIHEFVHACQQEKNPNASNVAWFWEALATNLADQELMIIDIPYCKDDMMHNFQLLVNAYTISYTIGKYMLSNLEKSQILEYVKYPEKLINDTDYIIENTRLWVSENTAK